MKELLLAIYRFRGFIFGAVKRDFQSRYKTSMLGGIWLVIQPLSMIVVYTVIFSTVMKAKLVGVNGTFAYSIYLCTGILLWGLFSEVVSRSMSVLIDNANLLKKLSFPRICLPLIVVNIALLNFIIIFAMFILFLVFSGNFPGIVFFSIIPVLFIMLSFSIGLGMTLGILNVFFRDVGQLMGILLQFWFWFTPIVYPVSILPVWAKEIIAYNPMAAVIGAGQSIMINKTVPDWTTLVPAIILSIVFLFVGLVLFRKHASDIVDEL
ncbi:ABC transporter permease [Sodalis sp. C49]|uniref:ABC transporter permease n=1 Tax=Sodalis sp. C49 TaxID=3228929 RepID=UPI0039658E05